MSVQVNHEPTLASSDEGRCLLPELNEPHLFKSRKSPARFYVLFLFSLFCFLNGFVWNTWNPIAASAQLVYKWGDYTPALLSAWGPIGFFPGSLIFPFVIRRFGLRTAVILSMLILALGTILKCFSTGSSIGIYLVHIGQFMNGFIMAMVQGATTTLSSNWFPYNERTFATGVSGLAPYLGLSFSFLIGPLVVSEINVTESARNNILPQQIELLTQQILYVIYMTAGLSTLLFVVSVIYFPSQAKHAPSITATQAREGVVSGVKKLFPNYSFWILSISYGATSGVCSSWLGYLFPNLSQLNKETFTQSYVGWLGFYCSISGTVAGVGAAILSDFFSKQKKVIILLLLLLGLVSSLPFTLLCGGSISLGSATSLLLIVLVVLIGIASNSPVGVFYELATEVTFPIHEAVSTTVLTQFNNAFSVVFLLIAEFPQLGSLWMNWTLVATFCLSYRFSRLLQSDTSG